MLMAVTIQWPLSGLVALGFKDVENRSAGTKHTGPLFIHSSKRESQAVDVDRVNANLGGRAVVARGEDGCYAITCEGRVYRNHPGEVIGLVRLDECVTGSQSVWAMEGKVHLCLSLAQPIYPVPMAGQLGVYRVPVEAEVALTDSVLRSHGREQEVSRAVSQPV